MPASHGAERLSLASVCRSFSRERRHPACFSADDHNRSGRDARAPGAFSILSGPLDIHGLSVVQALAPSSGSTATPQAAARAAAQRAQQVAEGGSSNPSDVANLASEEANRALNAARQASSNASGGGW